MVQILTVKYGKEEERMVMILNLAGISIGIPAGVLIGYMIGFFNGLESAADSSIGWAVFCLKIGLAVVPLSWGASILIYLSLGNRNKEAPLLKNVRRVIPGTLFFPLIMASTFLVAGLIVFPLGGLLPQYVGVTNVMIFDCLVLLPFVVIIGALLLPDTPAGKTLRRSLGRLRNVRGK